VDLGFESFEPRNGKRRGRRVERAKKNDKSEAFKLQRGGTAAMARQPPRRNPYFSPGKMVVSGHSSREKSERMERKGKKREKEMREMRGKGSYTLIYMTRTGSGLS